MTSKIPLGIIQSWQKFWKVCVYVILTVATALVRFLYLSVITTSSWLSVLAPGGGLSKSRPPCSIASASGIHPSFLWHLSTVPMRGEDYYFQHCLWRPWTGVANDSLVVARRTSIILQDVMIISRYVPVAVVELLMTWVRVSVATHGEERFLESITFFSKVNAQL